MKDTVQIKDASLDDLPVIRDLVFDLLDSIGEASLFNEEVSLSIWKSMIEDDNHHILVAWDGDTPVGLASLSTRFSLIHDSACGLIDELVVHRNHRGGGAGKLLIDAVIDRARTLGCCELEVSTQASNKKARAFYTSCGFEEDAVLLELDLD